MPYPHPVDLFDRTKEWADLASLVEHQADGLSIGVVSGRRRQGKSYLLRRLTDAANGLYHQALEVERAQALERFAGDIATRLGLPRGQLRFNDWEAALRTALGYPQRGETWNSPTTPAGPQRLLILDGLPYLLAHSPELPSILQELYDESRDGHYPTATVVVCGSALSVMVDLLSGTKPLRGRAKLDMTIQPFDYLTAATYWGITDPQTAFAVHTIFGGTAGYRPLVSTPPSNEGDVPAWLATNVLNPAHALFHEKDYLLREDSRITDKQLYNSILSSVAAGNHAPKDIGGPLARDANQLRHPLGTLTDAGFLDRDEDVLKSRRPLYFLADPIVKFTEVVIDPYRPQLEEGEYESVWRHAAPAYSSNVLGPHFERITRAWTRRYSGDRWGGEMAGVVGSSVVNDPAGRAQHELDVVALAPGARRGDPRARVLVLGEAKATRKPRDVSDLERLERIRQLLVDRRTDAAQAHLAVFSRNGFTNDLSEVTKVRSDVHLVDLDQLYPGLTASR